MISSRARMLTAQIEENAALEKKIEQSDAFRDTTAALVALKMQLHELATRYQRVADRLPVRIHNELFVSLEDVKSGLHGVGVELRKNPRQGAETNRLSSRVASVSTRVNNAWRETVTAELRPHQNVLELVGSLPEIASQRQAIDAIISRVLASTDSVPADDEALLRFDQDLERLAEILQEVEGLSLTVREFLQKVVNGRATFGDLDPEIMAWVTDRDRAQAFKICFGSSAR